MVRFGRAARCMRSYFRPCRVKRSRWAMAQSSITVKRPVDGGNAQHEQVPAVRVLAQLGELGGRQVDARMVGDQHVDLLVLGQLAHLLRRGDIGVEPAEVGVEVEAGVAPIPAPDRAGRAR